MDYGGCGVQNESSDKTVSKWENGKDSGYAILAELVNAVQNRPNAVYTGACFSLRVRVNT